MIFEKCDIISWKWERKIK